MTEHWLVTGAGGLLGANAALDLSDSGAIVTAYAQRARPSAPVPVLPVDLSTEADRAGIVERHGPTVVFHAAAVSSIEACEQNPALARRVNVDASIELAKQTRDAGGKFVLISTDAVFDGRRGHYREDDEVSPTTEYGRTKVAAEQGVLAMNPTALVLRVNFYGWSPSGSRSLAEFFYSRFEAGESPTGFTDVTVSTIYVRELVRSARRLVDGGASGIFHLASSEQTSKYEFGRRLAACFGWHPSRVVPGLSVDHLPVQRGSRLDLDVTRTETFTGELMADQAYSMQGLVADAVNGRREMIRQFEGKR